MSGPSAGGGLAQDSLAEGEAFEWLARLYLPYDEPSQVFHAGRLWHLPATTDRFSAWGSLPLRATGPRAMLGHGVRREAALLRMRLGPTRRRVRMIFRLAPRAVGVGPFRNLVRRALLGGAMVVLGPHSAGNRPMDHILASVAGITAGPLRPSGDGSVRLRVRLPEGQIGELRVAAVNTQRDPTNTAVCLRLLREMGVTKVPHIVGEGGLGDARWSVESHLLGRAPAQVRAGLAQDVADFCAQLVISGSRITSLAEGLSVVERLRPDNGPTIQMAGEWAAEQLNRLPAVVQHRDLWRANLLIENDRLTGVIDWDTWHPAGVPGADLLHLVAMERRRATGAGLGDLFTQRIWEATEFEDIGRPYWAALGLKPDTSLRLLVGLDWWAGQIATTAARPVRGALLNDQEWVRRNVDEVVEQLPRLIRG